MGKRDRIVLENVLIESIAQSNAVAHVDGKALFVPFCVPGDVVDVQVTHKRSSYLSGYVVRTVKFSDLRVDPFCEHFGECGGCSWQILPYEKQLEYKQQQVIDQLTRIGHLTLPEIRPILGSEKIVRYRNKLEFTFSHSKWLTFAQKAEADAAALAAASAMADTGALRDTNAPGMADAAALAAAPTMADTGALRDTNAPGMADAAALAAAPAIADTGAMGATNAPGMADAVALTSALASANSNAKGGTNASARTDAAPLTSVPASAESISSATQTIAPEAAPALGFHIPGRFDKVLDINHCHLQEEPSNEIRLFIKQYAIDNHLTFFNLRSQEGLLRNVMIRITSTGEIMVVLVATKQVPQVQELLAATLAKFPQITSLQYIINNKKNDNFSDLPVNVYAGKPFITEKMEDLQFIIGPKSFYQTNSLQAYRLYSVVREMAQLTPNQRVYDLYTGTGTIALFLAHHCKEVIGIEYVPEAIEDAKINAKNNGISNSRFYAGDMKDTLTADFLAKEGNPDLVVLDPPRAGVHQDVLDVLVAAAAPRMVYVSCNPGTQARDLQYLSAYYKITAVQPVDMFPHTQHVENVVLLERINN